MKKILPVIFAFASVLMHAQVVNRALQFESTGTVDCGAAPALSNLSSYSVQFWMNPSAWNEGASLISRGDDFAVELGATGTVVFKVGGKSVSVSSSDLKPGDWNQVTMVCDNGAVTTRINGADTGSGTLPAIPAGEDKLILGGNYSGMIDEVRIWNAALSSMFDYFTFNTLNKWAPQWDNLVAYYKMDQGDCENLVDYHALYNPNAAYNNHGVLSKGVTRVEANNAKMPYLWNAAYTENARFFDRIIPRDQYLLSNAIIILGANCIPQTGGIYTRTPNNHAMAIPGGTYLAEYEGREGVLQLDGKTSSYIQCTDSTFKPTAAYTFETWIYLDEWTPGAYILRKENAAKTQGFALYLSETPGQLICRVNGATYASRPNNFNLPTGKWTHIAVTPGNGSSVSETILFYLNGAMSRTLTGDAATTGKAGGSTPAGNVSLNAYIGEGLKCKLDETCMWYKTWPANNILSQMTYIPLPAITRNVNVDDMLAVDAYYMYDLPDELTFSSHSQDNWLRIMKSAFEGHSGYGFYLSVRGSDNSSPSWQTIINTPAKRKQFAADLAALSANYDGVELDLEWVYNASGWSNYALMADEIRAALPADKDFRISTHNVTYQYPVAKMDVPTGFTFQQYGPQPANFQYSNFTNNVQAFIKYGFPKDKIVTSYATTTSQGQPAGSAIQGFQKSSILDGYEVNWSNVDTKVINGQTYSFIGPMQAFRRALYTRQQGLQGIFYWDMGNDNWEGTAAAPVMPKFNSAKYASYGINANNDTIVTQVEVRHFDTGSVGSIRVDGETNGSELIVTPSVATDRITVSCADGTEPASLSIYSLAGACVAQGSESANTIDVASFLPGIYILTARDRRGAVLKGRFIKK